jgi:hypothetical protein
MNLSPVIIRLPPGCRRVSSPACRVAAVIGPSPHANYRTASGSVVGHRHVTCNVCPYNCHLRTTGDVHNPEVPDRHSTPILGPHREQTMHMRTAANRRERRTRQRPGRGVIPFALGLIFGLSYVELGLIVRVPDSTAANYFALANDLAPVFLEEMHDTSAKGPDAPDRHTLIPASLVGSARAAMASRASRRYQCHLGNGIGVTRIDRNIGLPIVAIFGSVHRRALTTRISP